MVNFNTWRSLVDGSEYGGIPDSGIARWNFEDDSDSTTAVDSWNNNDGSISGATYSSSSAVDSLALDFDGTDDEVDTPTSTPATSDWSIAYYFNTTKSTDNPAWGEWTSNDTYGLITGIAVRNSTYGGNSGRVAAGIRYDNTNANFWETSNSYDDGNYHQAVITYDPSGSDYTSYIRIYVDGNEQSTSLYKDDGDGGDIHDVDGFIGANPYDGNYFDGLVDDVRLYNKELSSTEVSNLYSTGSIS